MPETCGICEDGWVCETHGVPDCMEECGGGMACQNPTCPLSWDNEIDPRTGLIRPQEAGEPWRLASPVLRRIG